MAGLKSSEIHWVVHSYIGVENGHLGDMSVRTHREFYPAFCDLDIDPDAFSGSTKREKFIAVLTACDGPAQAAILRGVAKKYPCGSEHQRSQAAFGQLLALAKRCISDAAVLDASPAISSQVVDHALKDAAALLEARGPLSAVDRAHTALHGYMKAACAREGIEFPADAMMSGVFRQLRQHHPALASLGAHQDTVGRILNSLSAVLDALNPLRNKGSLAHANEELLSRDDALLAINASRTIIQYLDAKFMQVQKA